MFVVRLLRRGTGWIVVLLALVAAPLLFTYTSASFAAMQQAKKPSQQGTAKAAPGKILLDSRLPVQTFEQQAGFANENAKFGSRLNFTVLPQYGVVRSGTAGVFHENEASYIVGMSPTAAVQSGGSAQTTGQLGQASKMFIFHMGKANQRLGDSYVSNERWIEALNTTRWMGDAPDGEGMHMTVDIIDTFRGTPGCTAISNCAEAVKDDTVPVFMIGVSLQNTSKQTRLGDFVFGSNRAATSDTACAKQTTPQGTPVNVLSYDTNSDGTGGTLFMAGDATHWHCDTKQSDRAGLNWHYNVAAGQTQTSYFVLGGWNDSQHLFVNTQLSPSTCQNEGLYAAQEWSSQQDVIGFAIDNLSSHDNLLGQAQAMENYLINNSVLTPEQRWLIGDTLRSYKASSWLLGRQACAGGGYDAAVYEGSYGFLTTVDVMHEYGYFEITRVPWFFKSALTSVFNNATSNTFGLYFQHDQGGDVDASGNCTDPGQGIPTLRASCYVSPLVNTGVPMPTEENDNVVLLMAYYEFVTGDSAFLQQHIAQLDAAMIHNMNVGDPSTGIAYNGQDTNTTYDAASDCLHNDAPAAGNLYYQGLKEASGYRAAAYLDSLIVGNEQGAVWTQAATKIENAMVQAYNRRGYLPIADSSAFTNCGGRTLVLGESLFYLHLIGRDGTMNQTLLSDLATQYPSDLQADTLSNPAMVVMTSTAATGSQCGNGHCLRYEWFSKVMLSGLVADLVYTQHGCSTCMRVNVVQAAYLYNLNFGKSFGDGLHDDSSDWNGHFYPRGIISWAFLSIAY